MDVSKFILFLSRRAPVPPESTVTLRNDSPRSEKATRNHSNKFLTNPKLSRRRSSRIPCMRRVLVIIVERKSKISKRSFAIRPYSQRGERVTCAGDVTVRRPPPPGLFLKRPRHATPPPPPQTLAYGLSRRGQGDPRARRSEWNGTRAVPVGVEGGAIKTTGKVGARREGKRTTHPRSYHSPSTNQCDAFSPT